MRWIIFGIFFALANLHATLISKPPHSKYLPSSPQYERIMSSNEQYKQQILEKVRLFPAENYEIHLVSNLGLFLLDAKPDWIKDVLKRNIQWEEYIAPLIQKYAKPNTTVLDVGAH